MIAWLQCASGVSGDMLLGALVDVGVPLAVIEEAVRSVAPEAITVRAAQTTRAGIVATHVDVDVAPSDSSRTWREVRKMLEVADFAGRAQALATFELLARAEAAVHGGTPDEVHFHEVGALDAIADIVGVCAGFDHLGLTHLVVSPLALGGGWVRAAHGRLAVPAPAVMRLLHGVPSHGGPVDVELTTPTGAALAVTWADEWGGQPLMTVQAQGYGAGDRDLDRHANLVRLLIGEEAGQVAPPSHSAGAGEGSPDNLVIETNVDDLDGRVWPQVLTALLEAGADDAWLVPILMKKGRSAHTLHVLAPHRYAAQVRTIVFTHTSAIGAREHPVVKHMLPRAFTTVQVSGQDVRIKVATLGEHVVNAQAEWDDVRSASDALERPSKTVLAQALAAYWASR